MNKTLKASWQLVGIFRLWRFFYAGRIAVVVFAAKYIVQTGYAGKVSAGPQRPLYKPLTAKCD
jgi:hypothetical protein